MNLNRLGLIKQLSDERLLSMDGAAESGSERVNLIHESLIPNWERLTQAIAERRVEMKKRVRFEQYLADWLENNRAPGLLLDGDRLLQARELERSNSVAFQHPGGKEFLRASIEQQDAKQQALLQEQERRADAEAQARGEATRHVRNLRIAAGILALLFVAAVFFGFLALQQREVSDLRRLTAESTFLRREHLDRALLLGIEASRRDNGLAVRRNLLDGLLAQPQVVAFLNGHTNYVNGLAFSPDGTRLASASGDGTLRLWDVDTRRTIGEPLRGHTNFVESVAFSPDGRLLASGSSDNEIRLWDAATGAPSGEPLRGHVGPVKSVAFSPTAPLLASGSGDSTIRVWDMPNGELRFELRGHLAEVRTVAFSPDGKRLASGSGDDTIRVWDVVTGQQLGEPLRGHAIYVESVAFVPPDGKVLVSASGDATIRLWDVDTHEPLGEPLRGHSMAIWGMAVSPDGKLLASGGEDKTLRLWDIDPRSWVERACAIANHNLTRAEWETYVKTDLTTFDGYRGSPTCPDLPVAE